MLIAYEPVSDVLTITLSVSVPVQAQMQGTAKVNYDANGAVSTVEIPNASTVLWENGGQVTIALPVSAPPATAQVTTVVETTRVVEKPVL
jgi:uncharacterized protein YuzE